MSYRILACCLFLSVAATSCSLSQLEPPLKPHSGAVDSDPQTIATTSNSPSHGSAETANLLRTLDKLSAERGVQFVTYDASHHPTAIVIPDIVVTTNNLQTLGEVPTLRSISILCASKPIPPQSITPLSKLPSLEDLEIRGAYPELSTELATVLKTMQRLEILEVKYANVDRRALRMLATLPRLHTLKIEEQEGFTDDDAAVFSDFRTVEELDLSGTAITDKSVAFLVGMPHLRSLSLYGTHVTEVGVRSLRAKGHIKVVAPADSSGP